LDENDQKLYDAYIEEENYDSSNGEKIFQPIYMPLYLKLDVSISTMYRGYIPPNPLKKSLVIISDESNRSDYDKMLVNGFYVHGRAGIFDEMNYQDDDPENQIQPTK
jgi:hypothetical protein